MALTHTHQALSRLRGLPSQALASRYTGSGVDAAALSRSAASVDPYVSFGPALSRGFGSTRYPRPLRSVGRAARLGQSTWDQFLGELGLGPTAGGGSVTTNGTTQYVNAEGEDQSTPDPNAGSYNPLASLNAYGASLFPTMTTTGWLVVGAAAIGALVLLGGKK